MYEEDFVEAMETLIAKAKAVTADMEALLAEYQDIPDEDEDE